MKLFVRFFLAICFLQLGFLSSVQGYEQADKQVSETVHFSFNHQFTHSFTDVFDGHLEYNITPDTKAAVIDVEVLESEHEEDDEREHITHLAKIASAGNYFLALFNVLLRDPSTVSSNKHLPENGLVLFTAVRKHVRLCVFRV